MSEETPPNSPAPSQENDSQEISAEKALQPGLVSKWLSSKGFDHTILDNDHLGIETISVEPIHLREIATALKSYGFDYLQCQGGYDEGPGLNLVSFYHLISIQNFLSTNDSSNSNVQEVRIKVFLPRSGDLSVPSLYGLFHGADWQERETYDMFGINFDDHPHPKRLLMPEDWKGWPLRKDYVQPDFYEMQDAY
ncbi:NAD(P)H-quinone oxidoreductase subunit J [Prochlorococcus sp. MIT 1307]|uniref:NAD(P)H-quinone oxidoreductase subunit J n=1 Tax=Prochlorococcus sp. MIT 1307 TaxID=3096219 RepID=UPI002A761878|nr:NAD(P)H-quinone oxidoreductase subunit J [Prochlorococcus sp. MIT 1307]